MPAAAPAEAAPEVISLLSDSEDEAAPATVAALASPGSDAGAQSRRARRPCCLCSSHFESPLSEP